MTDISKQNEVTAASDAVNAAPSRRQLLKIGAVAAPAVLTLKPGHAWAASFNCSVRIPYIIQNADGTIVPVLPIDSEPPASVPAGQTIIAPPRVATGRFYLGNEILGTGLPDAHIRYLTTVSAGQGLTCLQSIGFIRTRS
jgi:hypothetical protein